MTSPNRNTPKNGIKMGIPLFLSYFPVAIAFGILSKNTGLNIYETVGFSVIVFAGASQFMAVSMIASGSMGLEIIIATLFLNFRHFLMSSSISQRIDFENPIMKPIVGFFITDETFSVASFTRGEFTEKYMLAMEVTAYLGWVTGTGIGFILGSILPMLLQKSMAIGLYALFVALLIPEIKKTNKALVLALASGVTNTILVKFLDLQQGWSIVVSIVLISSLGVLIYEKEERFYE